MTQPETPSLPIFAQSRDSIIRGCEVQQGENGALQSGVLGSRDLKGVEDCLGHSGELVQRGVALAKPDLVWV